MLQEGLNGEGRARRHPKQSLLGISVDINYIQIPGFIFFEY